MPDILLARVHAAERSAIAISILRAGGLAIYVASPITTQVVCEDELQVVEALVNVATRALEVGCGGTKFAGVGI